MRGNLSRDGFILTTASKHFVVRFLSIFMTSPTKWTVTTNGLFGLWLLSAPFIFEAPVAARWNNVLVGIGILVIGGYNYSRKQTRGILSRRAAAVSGLLGGWLLIAPFVFETPSLLFWNDLIVGIGVVSLAMYNIYAAPRLRRANTQAYPEEI